MDEWVSDTVPAVEAAGDGQYAADSDYISAPDGEDSAEALPEADGTSQPPEEAETPEDGRADIGRDTEKPGRPAPAFTVPVKYNKQYRELTPEEAGIYAQKGMKYDALEPDLAKLKQLAALSGRSLSQVIDGIYRANQELEKQDCMRLAGGNPQAAAELLEARNLKGGRAYEALLEAERKASETERAATGSRLADEFIQLQRECPEIGSLDDLPDSVLEAAARKETPLMLEYLLYRRREENSLRRAKEDGAAARTAAAGSLRDLSGDSQSPAFSAMLDGLWK